MPVIIAEAIKIVFSIFVVGYLSALSFLGLKEPSPAETELSIQPEIQIDERIFRPAFPPEPSEKEETQEDHTKKDADAVDIADIEVAPIFVPVPAETPEVSEEPIAPSFSEINVSTRVALVNILCTGKSSGYFNPITASGVIIDSRGVILTNAHVAQFLLLRDYPTEDTTECVVRTGSPARPAYTVELLHISPAWVHDNADNITMQDPLGTGENDFAFLLIDDPIDDSKQTPRTFAFVSPDIDDTNIQVGDTVLLAGYPAGFLDGITIQKDLFITSTIGIIEELFTFKKDTLDLVSVEGSILSQKGASGGAVVSADNKLIGIIVTATEEATTGERELRAITLAHINRSLLMHAGHDLPFLLFGDAWVKARWFNLTIAPTLTKLLVNEIEK